MIKGTKAYQLSKIFTGVHLTIIAIMFIVMPLNGGRVAIGVYVFAFFVAEFVYFKYTELATPNRMWAKAYMFTAATQIIWYIFIMYLPQMLVGEWTSPYLWSNIYIFSSLIGGVSIAGITWVRKIASS